MSIRGIDTQIMITRLTDNVREASVLQKRLETAQDFLAARQRINDAEQQSRVAKTSESDTEKVRTDVDGGGSGSNSSGNDSNSDDEQYKEPDPDMIVPAGNNIIDISV